MENCSICINEFTDNKRKRVLCSCDYPVCIYCTKTYLMSTTKDPHCMNCKKGWTRDVQYRLLGSSFINTTYNKHRKTILVENEKVRQIETQYYAKQLRKETELKIKLDDILKEERDLKYKLTKIHDNKIYNIQQTQYITNELDGVIGTTKTVTLKTSFKCPKDGCKGYVMDKTCGLCDSLVCKKCIHIVNNINEHKCDENDLATAKLILNDSKPCPKCSVRISKVDGCDQMWCTQCQTAFSWSSGSIVTGVVHNPHFYQWMNQNGTQNNNRNPGDEVCGGIPTTTRVRRIFSKTDSFHRLTSIHRGLSHTQYTILNPLRRELNIQENNYRLRARFMMDDIDEKRFGTEIMKLDKQRSFKQAILDIFETYVNVTSNHMNHTLDLCMNKSIEEKHVNVKLFIDTIRKLQDYCNNELTKTSRNYNLVTWFICENMSVSSIKKKL
jgi:hypothetical protein